MGELTSERYKEFKANDCVKTEPDIKELIKVAMDEDRLAATVVTAKQRNLLHFPDPTTE